MRNSGGIPQPSEAGEDLLFLSELALLLSVSKDGLKEGERQEASKVNRWHIME